MAAYGMNLQVRVTGRRRLRVTESVAHQDPHVVVDEYAAATLRARIAADDIPIPATLQVFHGDGEVRDGPNGVDLVNFSLLLVDHPDPEGTSMEVMRKWFVRQFSWDPRACSAMVYCLWTRSSDPVAWELKHVYRTSTWVKWLKWCRRHGHEFSMLVQACPRQVCDDIDVRQISMPVQRRQISAPEGRAGVESTNMEFFGNHNPVSHNFWPSCRHGEGAVVQDYERLGGDADAARLFFRCPYFETEDDCGYKFLVDPRMEPRAQEYTRHLQVVIQELEAQLQRQRNNNTRHLSL